MNKTFTTLTSILGLLAVSTAALSAGVDNNGVKCELDSEATFRIAVADFVGLTLYVASPKALEASLATWNDNRANVGEPILDADKMLVGLYKFHNTNKDAAGVVMLKNGCVIPNGLMDMGFDEWTKTLTDMNLTMDDFIAE